MQTIKRNIFSVLVLGLAGVMAVNTSGHSVWGRARVVSVCTVGWPGSHALRTSACGLPILLPLLSGPFDRLRVWVRQLADPFAESCPCGPPALRPLLRVAEPVEHMRPVRLPLVPDSLMFGTELDWCP